MRKDSIPRSPEAAWRRTRTLEDPKGSNTRRRTSTGYPFVRRLGNCWTADLEDSGSGSREPNSNRLQREIPNRYLVRARFDILIFLVCICWACIDWLVKTSGISRWTLKRCTRQQASARRFLRFPSRSWFINEMDREVHGSPTTQHLTADAFDVGFPVPLQRLMTSRHHRRLPRPRDSAAGRVGGGEGAGARAAGREAPGAHHPRRHPRPRPLHPPPRLRHPVAWRDSDALGD